MNGNLILEFQAPDRSRLSSGGGETSRPHYSLFPDFLRKSIVWIGQRVSDIIEDTGKHLQIAN
jgi:hypothetical protein